MKFQKVGEMTSIITWPRKSLYLSTFETATRPTVVRQSNVNVAEYFQFTCSFSAISVNRFTAVHL